MTEEKKEFWASASKDGLIFGFALTLTMAIGVIFRLEIEHPNLSSLLTSAVLALCVYFFARRRSLSMGDAGFTFAQSMAYILAIALFAGFIYGAMLFITWNYIAVDYYNEILQLTQQIYAENAIDEQTMQLTQNSIQSPVIMIMASIISVLLHSCFIGIICSVFTKRFPKLDDTQQYDQPTE